jgi:DNA-binding IclR family transcriptional regulator
MKLTRNEQEVMALMRSRTIVTNDWISPTQIGNKLRPSRMSHSSWASPICKRLVNKGLLERNEKGWYRLKERQDGQNQM